jgi:hypothetical protein
VAPDHCHSRNRLERRRMKMRIGTNELRRSSRSTACGATRCQEIAGVPRAPRFVPQEGSLRSARETEIVRVRGSGGASGECARRRASKLYYGDTPALDHGVDPKTTNRPRPEVKCRAGTVTLVVAVGRRKGPLVVSLVLRSAHPASVDL